MFTGGTGGERILKGGEKCWKMLTLTLLCMRFLSRPAPNFLPCSVQAFHYRLHRQLWSPFLLHSGLRSHANWLSWNILMSNPTSKANLQLPATKPYCKCSPLWMYPPRQILALDLTERIEPPTCHAFSFLSLMAAATRYRNALAYSLSHICLLVLHDLDTSWRQKLPSR